ncbi:hypothetical protein EMIT043CA1_180146 [Pseudomonas brassicacearum]
MADPPPSRASSLPQGGCGEPDANARNRSSVGASLLAMEATRFLSKTHRCTHGDRTTTLRYDDAIQPFTETQPHGKPDRSTTLSPQAPQPGAGAGDGVDRADSRRPAQARR